MKCYICDSENWHSTGKLHSLSEIIICRTCGNVAHKVELSQEADMIKYYRGVPYTDSKGVEHKKGYRPEPNHYNLITTNNKINYIKIFLHEYLVQNKEKRLVCGDVGCATGYLPHFLRTLGHKATGCEYTLAYRRFAENFYGIPISEELPKKFKYDLISLYHVLEHMIEPDKKLLHYVNMLKDEGFMLIATPEWFNKIAEAAETTITSFDNLFNKDHINLFSANSIRNLFLKCGLKIVKENHEQYGQTYLLQKLKPGEKSNIKYVEDNWQLQEKFMQLAKQSIDLFGKKMYKEALAVYPKFPEAWMKLVFISDRKTPEVQENLFAEIKKYGLKSDIRCIMGEGQWYYQRQEYEKALKLFIDALKIKPFGDLAMQAGYCYFFLGQYNKAVEMFLHAHMMTPTSWGLAMDWACKAASSGKAWDEKFRDGMIDKINREGKLSPNMVDKFMEGDKPNEPIEPEIVEQKKETENTTKTVHSVQSENDTTEQK